MNRLHRFRVSSAELTLSLTFAESPLAGPSSVSLSMNLTGLHSHPTKRLCLAKIGNGAVDLLTILLFWMHSHLHNKRGICYLVLLLSTWQGT